MTGKAMVEAHDSELTEAQRQPLLAGPGRALLLQLHEHPAAPRFNHRCGDRLDVAGLSRVREFAEGVRQGPETLGGDGLPPWLLPFAGWCCRDVPFYRSRGPLPAAFSALPTTSRDDLAPGPWRFVPDSQPLDDLIVYTTSGTTTGHALQVLSHPDVSSMTLPLLQAALALHGVELAGGPDRVSVVLVCCQRRTYTYASISSYLDGAAFAKINLHPGEWRSPDDPARYLDAFSPEVYTGDPLSFAALAGLPLTSRPKALISTAMTLLPGLRAGLEAHFGCPVVDLYSLNEAGPVAAEKSGRFVPLQPRLHIEVLDDAGRLCPPGERGEITLTGGFNPFLPLLRYRTGDYAAWAEEGGGRALVGLEGRAPVMFRGREGQGINNVDVSAALRPFALPQFTLRQHSKGALSLSIAGSPLDTSPVRAALLALFGAGQPLAIDFVGELGGPGAKVQQYVVDEAA